MSTPLTVVLVALLPKDGTAIPVKHLAGAACATVADAADALASEVAAGTVRYDALTNSYAAVKRGDALPTRAAP